MMQQLLRNCRQKDHDDKWVDNLCVHPACQTSRFMCSKCIKDEIHKHDKNNKQNILDEKEFNKYVKQAIGQKKSSIKQNQKLYENLINQMNSIILHLKNLISELQQWFMTDNILGQLDIYQKKAQQGFGIIDEHIVNRIIKFNKTNQHEEIIGHIQKYSQIIIQNFKKLEEWGNSLKDNQIKSERTQKEMNNKYNIIKIFEASDSNINTATISENLKYIAGGIGNQLYVWNFQDNRLLEQIQFHDEIYHCKFTQDSEYLSVITCKNVFWLEYNYNKKEKFKFNQCEKFYIQQPVLNFVIIKDQALYLAYSDGYLSKYDCGEEIKVKAHTSSIRGLDYYHSMIATGSDDKSIKLWNAEQGFKILEKQQAHQKAINQIQFSKYQLISSDIAGQLKIWSMLYEQEILQEIGQIKYPTGIFNIQVAKNLNYQEMIILTCKDQVKIHTIEGDFVFEFNHYIEKPECQGIYQIQSMKYIIVLGKKQLKICKG